MGHYVLNVPPYVPGYPQFYGSPGAAGDILTDERVSAFALISAFGRQGHNQSLYVRDFFNGVKDPSGAYFSYPYGHTAQLGDVGDHFALDSAQAAAINAGTSVTRPEFISAATAQGIAADGETRLPAVSAYQASTVVIGKVGSEYAKICADFQHNLNGGGHGGAA
jgi:hypothetical protein